jgi:acylphosphatase/phosphate uptake regulator
LIKAEIIVKGKVQKVGYRDYVQEVARSLNVKGYVENLRDGSVKIICEAEKDTLEKFTQMINIKTDLVQVEKIEIVKKEPAKGEYSYFDIKYGIMEEEIGERIVAAFKIATMTREDIKNMHADMKEMRQDLKGSITSMHRDLKGSITSMHEDLKGSITSMHRDLKGSITSMHEDLKGSIVSMHQDLKGSITSMHEDIKSMHVDLKSSIDSMHQDINRHFEEMAKRYDTISAELLKTREELKRAVDTLVELVRKFLEKS